jgi:hypothetical protein
MLLLKPGRDKLPSHKTEMLLVPVSLASVVPQLSAKSFDALELVTNV